ncbi:MAG: PepSY domain-containing protein [Candidatus Rokubacteria bacterium]|nr:PepSY domain-containing protein [Candidatus Rokubacteria bacterium]
MKRVLGVTLAVALIGGLAGVALAWGPGMGPGWRGAAAGGYGPGWMMGGGRMMGGGGGFEPGGCPGAGFAAGGAPGAPAEAITEEKAKEIASEYVSKYFKGYTVERIVPFTGRFQTMYQVELKGPKGETRILHVNPWGNVRPWGPPTAG